MPMMEYLGRKMASAATAHDENAVGYLRFYWSLHHVLLARADVVGLPQLCTWTVLGKEALIMLAQI